MASTDTTDLTPTPTPTPASTLAPAPDPNAKAVARFLAALPLDSIRPQVEAYVDARAEHEEGRRRRVRIDETLANLRARVAELRPKVSDDLDRLEALELIGEVAAGGAGEAREAANELTRLERQERALTDERDEAARAVNRQAAAVETARNAVRGALAPVLQAELRARMDGLRDIFHLVGCWYGVPGDYPSAIEGVRPGGDGSFWRIDTGPLGASLPSKSAAAPHAEAWFDAVLERVLAGKRGN